MCGANPARKFAGVQTERRLHDELGKNPGKIGIQRDPPFADLCRAVCLPQIDAGVDRFGILAVIRQKGYLIMTGVLKPTPNSRKRIFCPSRVRRKLLCRSAALCQPSSSTKVSSQRRFMVIGLPQTGQ